ncbi:MAG TPA: hypothetical protein HA222_00295 [Candidatus Diapherotrites archaeon]|uniref:Signal peptidase I n=1 Tax=Candidatus Iainarchaeum sp. TaxID=3101447 RepID=A0A7J4JWR1_9ARCH|nr:hypothetical protein [Candidatus Diapherotrites archaeon]
MPLKKKLQAFRKKLKWLDPFTYVDLLLEKYWPVKHGKKTDVQEIGYTLVYIVSAFIFAFLIYQFFALALQTNSPIVIVISESMEPNLYRGDVVFIQGASFASLKAQELFVPENVSGKLFSEFAEASYSPSQVSNAGKELSAIQAGGKEIKPSQDGDIILYYSSFTGEQIIHRVVAKLNALDASFLLTKGDNEKTNWTFDQDCGKKIQEPILGTDTSRIIIEKPCITLYPLKISEIEGKAVFRIPIIGCVKVWVFDDLPSLISKGAMPEHYNGGLC